VGVLEKLNPCLMERAAGVGPTNHGYQYDNWPDTISYKPAQLYRPRTRPELCNAILDAERAGFRLRAIGTGWSFSDVTLPVPDSATASSAATPNRTRVADNHEDPAARGTTAPGLATAALIDTTALAGSLQSKLPQILVDPSREDSLFFVEAGMTVRALNVVLDALSPRASLPTNGGAAGQTIAGAISTSTHGGDVSLGTLCDHIVAMHLVGAGGVEYWLEPSGPGVADTAKLQQLYPCLASGNVIRDDDTFHAALVSFGSIGVIYSVILEVRPQFGIVQHRALTTWVQVQSGAGPGLAGVLDGSFVDTFLGDHNRQPTPNRFAQIAINPYAQFDGAEISPRNWDCWVTNRYEVDVPAFPVTEPSVTIDQLNFSSLQPAITRPFHGFNPDLDTRLLQLQDYVNNHISGDVLSKVTGAFDWLMNNDFNYWPIVSSIITQVLNWIVPPNQAGLQGPVYAPPNVSFEVADVVGFTTPTRGLSVEAAFSIPNAVAYVNDVLNLIYQLAQPGRAGGRVYVAGYLSMRFVSQTKALLGMQRLTANPNDTVCFVEYAMLRTLGSENVVASLQDLVLRNDGASSRPRGILHWGQCNDKMTRANFNDWYSAAAIDKFRRARQLFRHNGELRTFDNVVTAKFDLDRGPG
jgi:hypothetical protein